MQMKLCCSFLLAVMALCVFADDPATKSLKDYETELRREFPFVEHKKGDKVAFVIDNGETKVSGTVVRINAKGVMIEDDGVGILYSINRLPLTSSRLFYKEKYEEWITRMATERKAEIDNSLVTKSGAVYKNYTIEKATPYGLSIFHDDGAATVLYSELPDDIRAKYKEEEKNAPAEIARIEEDKKKAAFEQKLENYIKEKHIALLEPEFLELIPYRVQGETTIFAALSVIKSERILICGIDTSTLRQGDIISNDTEIVEAWTGGGSRGGFSTREVAPISKVSYPVKVLRCWNIGTYTLQLAFGSTIIRKYTANKQEALEYCKRELLKRAKK